VADTAGAAAEAASNAATEAVNAASEAAGQAADAATEAAGAVSEAVSETIQSATEAAPAVGAEAASSTEMPEALTLDGFDFDTVSGLIKDANLGAMQENLLIEGIKASENNPDLLKSALEAAQKALGY